MCSKFFSLVLCALFIGILPGNIQPVSAQKHTAGEISQLSRSILERETAAAEKSSVQEWIDTVLAENTGSYAEWYILALNRTGNSYDFSAYADKLALFLESSPPQGAASSQKYALAMLAAGYENTAYISGVMRESIGAQGVMSLIFGLHLINNGCTSPVYTKAQVIRELLDMRIGGGWNVTGSTPDTDITAMAIQALAPHYAADGEVKSAVDAALALLLQNQLESGGFASYGTENAESSAQVILALCALGIDPMTDFRFIKDGNTILSALLQFRLADQGFSHTLGGEYSSSAASQVFCALTAMELLYAQRGSFYILEPESPADNFQTDIPKTSVSETENSSITSAGRADSIKAASPGYKLWICAGVCMACVAVCAVLYLRGKRNRKSYIAVLAVCFAAVLFALLTDFSSADDYYNSYSKKANAIGTVTLTIRCDTVAGKSDKDYIPENGIILEETEFALADGDSVYTILTEAAREYRIQLDTSGSGSMVYVRGINYLYQTDFGALSGWVYRVNREMSDKSCSEYLLSDGDKIEWLYTLEPGDAILIGGDTD